MIYDLVELGRSGVLLVVRIGEHEKCVRVRTSGIEKRRRVVALRSEIALPPLRVEIADMDDQSPECLMRREQLVAGLEHADISPPLELRRIGSGSAMDL